MWRALMSSRFASWVVGMVSIPKARQQQHDLDLQRLYILTRMHKASAQGKSPNMQKLLLESHSLEPSSIHREVQAALQLQVAGMAHALHDILLQAGDPAPAAAAMTAAHQRLLRRRERNASGLSKLLRSFSGSGAVSGTVQSATHYHQHRQQQVPNDQQQQRLTTRQPPTGPPAEGASSTGEASAPSAPSAASAAITAAATAGPGSSSEVDWAGSSGGGGVSSSSSISYDGGGGGGGVSSGSSISYGGGGGGGDSSSSGNSISYGGGGGELVSQCQLAAALQRRIGFRLELGPSTVPHPEAGTGLFLRGEARPGAVVAIFPGVLYGRTQLAHMPNFPKIDTDNPFLSCRYDQSIVDSKPWGRGDPGVTPAAGDPGVTPAAGDPRVAQASTAETPAAATRAAYSGRTASMTTSPGASDSSSSSSSSSSTGSGGPSGSSDSSSGGGSSGRSSGGSSGSSSGGSSGRSSGGSSGSSRPWWGWSGPLSSSLSQLEGRHPLALGHFVNHPGRGQTPNVIEAALDVPLDLPDLDAAATRPWLRAYLPTLQPPLHYNPYGKGEDDADDDSDDDDDDDDNDDVQQVKAESRPAPAAAAAVTHGSAAAAAVAHGSAAAAARRSRPRLPGELRSEELLRPPGGVVRLLVLVATRAVRDGEELMQNYRMNPHVMRPDWYVVHDAEAEERRWAKVKALDLGFKARGGAAAGAGGGGGSAGGGGGGAAGG